jgi:hypothetical protein
MEGCDVTIVDQIPRRTSRRALPERRGESPVPVKEKQRKLLGSHIVRSVDDEGVVVEDCK